MVGGLGERTNLWVECFIPYREERREGGLLVECFSVGSKMDLIRSLVELENGLGKERGRDYSSNGAFQKRTT